ncbi:hypothetical protein Lepto7375DRAFT_0095 [Leptolyngbya sp. PCC 7375]|nr:hypothetical protein Lepto7375DRAFT_0095 [Leptolyngbya sp. PCC 7375]
MRGRFTALLFTLRNNANLSVIAGAIAEQNRSNDVALRRFS